MTCPACGVALVMSERQGVEIDYCPSCRGVWLDRGELDKIIERSARDLAAPPAPTQTYRPDRDRERYSQPEHGHYGDKGYPKRRKSFLEDLFD
jgi:Zn-finger nucleic acid-binding protein